VPTEAQDLKALYQQQNNSYATTSSLQDVTPNQLITVKAKLLQLSATKNVIMHDSKTVKKQEGIIVYTTGYMKIVLWEEHWEICRKQHRTKSQFWRCFKLLKNSKMAHSRWRKLCATSFLWICDVDEKTTLKTSGKSHGMTRSPCDFIISSFSMSSLEHLQKAFTTQSEQINVVVSDRNWLERDNNI